VGAKGERKREPDTTEPEDMKRDLRTKVCFRRKVRAARHIRLSELAIILKKFDREVTQRSGAGRSGRQSEGKSLIPYHD